MLSQRICLRTVDVVVPIKFSNFEADAVLEQELLVELEAFPDIELLGEPGGGVRL